MTIWKNTDDGPVMHLRPSRILIIPYEGATHRHAFGQIVGTESWPEFRLGSEVLEDGVDEEGRPFIRTKSRRYIVEGQNELFHSHWHSQLREFLAGWRIPTEEWEAVLAQARGGKPRPGAMTVSKPTSTILKVDPVTGETTKELVTIVLDDLDF